MKNVFTFLLILVCSISCLSQEKDYQLVIQSAILAAPENMQEHATVLAYDDHGKVVAVKKGSNEMICLADNPKVEGFNAACYHRDLEPFMARGRELKQEGKTPQEIFSIREEEVQSGKLKMPDHPSTLHILYGPDAKYDESSNSMVDAKYRYVIYIPYATPESTGLLTRPRNPGDPWLMDPGTHRAHIMVTPSND